MEAIDQKVLDAALAAPAQVTLKVISEREYPENFREVIPGLPDIRGSDFTMGHVTVIYKLYRVGPGFYLTKQYGVIDTEGYGDHYSEVLPVDITYSKLAQYFYDIFRLLRQGDDITIYYRDQVVLDTNLTVEEHTGGDPRRLYVSFILDLLLNGYPNFNDPILVDSLLDDEE